MLQTPVRSAKNATGRANSGLKAIPVNQRASAKNLNNAKDVYNVKTDMSVFTDTTKENFKSYSPSPKAKTHFKPL